MMRKIVSYLLLIPLFTSCLKDDYVDYTVVDEEIISTYLTEHNIDAERHSSGLYYQIVNFGSGAPIGANESIDEKVTFSYKGYLTNGKVFADTEGKNVTQYLSQLLYGFQIGFQEVNRLGQIHLYVPSGLAYGAAEKNGVPANSVVIFEVKIDRDQDDMDEEIISTYLEEQGIEAQRDESGLYYQILEPGDGPTVPETAWVDVSYKGSLLNGEIFDEGTLSRTPLDNLIEAWRIGVPKLKKGSKAIFYCPSQLCYGSSTRYDEDGKVSIPSNSILIFEMTIVNF
ncbi:FKBP-type peptidyl-prolyl cis-trans isomerase [Carboxylicivirga taeanensis]|uniref:FKBP-type peptidyl-prolyl cis-trans isomerase n=1 Tax=Carboxylicivirga taeanensis TaxID=1416875 RepID=UPI003F6E14E1